MIYTYDRTGNVASARSTNSAGLDVAYTWDAAHQLVGVTDNRLSAALTAATYSPTGVPTRITHPTGVAASYTYDPLDRPTSLVWSQGSATPLAGYTYALAPTGHRLSVTEPSGRQVSYGYDATHRLTAEAITGDSVAARNGALGYTLDPVGNRLQRTSTLAALPPASYAYDANDRLTTDGYDPNGNTITRDGATYTYDFADRLLSKNGGEVTLLYDGDGTLVGKTAGGVTTRYLVDELSPSGLSQVVEELAGGAVQRVYTYGSKLISSSQLAGGNFTTSYGGYDAQGNMTFLTDDAGVVTDTYAYDAFGNLIARTGSTPNEHLYGGQRFDADLGLYHLRARYYEPNRGRFLTVDPFEGVLTRPISLNKYLYAHADPVNLSDPEGRLSATERGVLTGIVVRTLPAAAALSLAESCALFVIASAVWEPFMPPYGFQGCQVSFAKGGKKNLENEYVRDARRLQPGDPCQWLRAQYEIARAARDTIAQRKIIQAQKFLGCRHHGGG